MLLLKYMRSILLIMTLACACKHTLRHTSLILSVRDPVKLSILFMSLHVWVKLRRECLTQGADVNLHTTRESYHLIEKIITSLCEFTCTETEEARPLQSEGKLEERGISLSPKAPSKGFSYAVSVQIMNYPWLQNRSLAVAALHGILVCKIMRMIPRNMYACIAGLDSVSVFPSRQMSFLWQPHVMSCLVKWNPFIEA